VATTGIWLAEWEFGTLHPADLRRKLFGSGDRVTLFDARTFPDRLAGTI